MRKKDNSSEMQKIKSRINWFCENKINAFSPTISPAPKSLAERKIESIRKAFEYYRANQITDIVVQKKYMGSYCDIYLHKKLEDTYFVSRNGFKINHIDLEAAIIACKTLHQKIDWSNLSIAIIQAEMLPWSILGKGLIQAEFGGYLDAHKTQNDFLKKSSIIEKLKKIKLTPEFEKFDADSQKMSSKEFKSAYKSHIVRQYSCIQEITIQDQNKYEQAINIFGVQLETFGRITDISFKPFNILKYIFDDGSEVLVNDNSSFKLINDDPCLEFSIHSDNDIENAVSQTENWFNTLTVQNEEGIVIKPKVAFIPNIAPALKIRNDNYLVMIYGIDFLDRLENYIDKRNIRKKIECSVNDWMINWEMLKVPYSAINTENYYLKNLVLDRILQEKTESTLDNRL